MAQHREQLVVAALVFLLVTSGYIWRDDLRRGAPPGLGEVPAVVVLGDLAAAGVWMAASAPNERSVAFVIVLGVGALAMFRLGAVGIVLTGATYIVGRVAQELIRLSLGIPTPPAQLSLADSDTPMWTASAPSPRPARPPTWTAWPPRTSLR